MEHYLDYLKALVGHIQHDAATFYANWKQAEAKAAEDLRAAEARFQEEKNTFLERIAQLEGRPTDPPAAP